MTRLSATSRPSSVSVLLAYGSVLEAAAYCGLKLYWEFGGRSGVGTGIGGNPYENEQFAGAPEWAQFIAGWGTIIMAAAAVVVCLASVHRFGARVSPWFIALPAWAGFAMLALTYTKLPMYVEMLPFSLLFPNPFWATLLGATAASFTYRAWFAQSRYRL